jgi:hypothetical protein
MLKDRRIAYSYHDAFTSMLEAVFARGGRELAPVLAAAAEKGCRFDSWTEELRRDAWREAFEEAGMDMEALATASFGYDSPLPWDRLDYGVSKAFLWREYEKSLNVDTTRDCRYHGCAGCGVCADGAGSADGAGGAGSTDGVGGASGVGGAGGADGAGSARLPIRVRGNVLYGEAVEP